MKTAPRPEKTSAAPAAPAVDPVLDALEARERAPMEAAAAATRAARERLQPIEARARASLARLRALQPICEARLAAIGRLPLAHYQLRLGGHSTIVSQLRAELADLALLFRPRDDPGGTTASVCEDLARIPRRIEQLVVAKNHVCVMPPPPCGCGPSRITLAVEDAEYRTTLVPSRLATITDLVSRLEMALAIRGDDGVDHRPAPPRPAGITVNVLEEGA